MFKQTSKSLLLAAALILPFSLQATERPSVTTVAPSAAITAAHQLLETMNMRQTYASMLERITQMQLQQNPELVVIQPTIHAFFKKYMGWDALKDDMAAIYAKNYTAQELGEINAFYQTPVGQKTVQLMPQLAAAGAQIGQSKLAAHMGELQMMIEAELKKINAEKK